MRAFLGGGVGGRGSLLHAVGRFDNEEDDEGNDKEVNDGLDECAVLDDFSNGQFAKVDSAHEQTNGGHDDVVDERTDNFSKCTANDNADGEVEHVAAHDEFFEFF